MAALASEAFLQRLIRILNQLWGLPDVIIRKIARDWQRYLMQLRLRQLQDPYRIALKRNWGFDEFEEDPFARMYLR